jgi:predicted Zn-ribbon and HTH transcriptional regulator
MGAHYRAPRFELADIVRKHRAALERSTHLSAAQRRVLTDIAQCRTAVLGGHLDVCDDCGYEHPSYNSCRNRHCPKCQALTQERWIEQQRQRLLDVPHFHVVFTLPAELRALAAWAPRVVFNLLFRCASATLREFGYSHLDATLGATLVLHTWTKELLFHPHVHAVVTGGGLRDDGAWVPAQQRFLFPVKALSRVFRGKMRAALREAYDAGVFRNFDDFCDPEGFDHLSNQLGQKDWYVYAKRSFTRAKYVVEYLGRYTHRVGLSNSRLLAVSDDRVVIRTRGDGRAVTTGPELLRRFIRHVLPDNFHKIRHFGLYASPQARAGLTHLAEAPTPLAYRERLYQLTGRDIARCPCCGGFVTPRPLPSARAPPRCVA